MDYTTRHDTWDEYLRFITDAPNLLPSTGRTSEDRGANWSGTDTYAQAFELAEKGWPDGTQQVKDLAEMFYLKISSKVMRPTISFDVAPGMGIDMGRYMSGEPEVFMVWEETEIVDDRKGQIVHVVFNQTVSAGISTAVMFRRGAAVASLVDLLESTGRRCKVEVVLNITSGYKEIEGRVTVKSPDQPLNLDILAFALCNPASFRRIGFRWMESAPAELRRAIGITHGGGYGMPHTTKEQGDIYLGEATYGEPQWNSDEGTRQWIEKTLTEQGVILSD